MFSTPNLYLTYTVQRFVFTDALKLQCFFCTDMLSDVFLRVPSCIQIFQASSANEWKTINVKNMFTESDEEVFVKCSTWTADGKHIICAARNAVLVSILFGKLYSYFTEWRCRLLFLVMWGSAECVIKRV